MMGSTAGRGRGSGVGRAGRRLAGGRVGHRGIDPAGRGPGPGRRRRHRADAGGGAVRLGVERTVGPEDSSAGPRRDRRLVTGPDVLEARLDPHNPRGEVEGGPVSGPLRPGPDGRANRSHPRPSRPSRPPADRHSEGDVCWAQIAGGRGRRSARYRARLMTRSAGFRTVRRMLESGGVDRLSCVGDCTGSRPGPRSRRGAG